MKPLENKIYIDGKILHKGVQNQFTIFPNSSLFSFLVRLFLVSCYAYFFPTMFCCSLFAFCYMYIYKTARPICRKLAGNHVVKVKIEYRVRQVAFISFVSLYFNLLLCYTEMERGQFSREAGR